MVVNAKVRPFLMFTGQAEEAIRFYVSLIPASEVLEMARYGPGQPGKEGTVLKALFRLGDLELMAIDSYVQHDFMFTPSVSLFVTCASEEEIGRLSVALAEGGAELMPLGNYGFSRKFAWVNDRFGVSWQLNLE